MRPKLNDGEEFRKLLRTCIAAADLKRCKPLLIKTLETILQNAVRGLEDHKRPAK